MALFHLANRHFLGFRMIFKVRLNQIFSNFKHNAMYHKIQIKFDYGEIDIYRSWIMALFFLEEDRFLDENLECGGICDHQINFL
jgi:hypothetical protein